MLSELSKNPDLVALNPELLGESQEQDDDSMIVPFKYSLRRAKFKSLTERDSLQEILSRYQHQVKWLRYEPIILRLPGGNYTPDWLLGAWCYVYMIEVKGTGGFRSHQSGRSSRIQLATAARFVEEAFGWSTLLMKKTPTGWEVSNV